jgi:hypothetical protein
MNYTDLFILILLLIIIQQDLSKREISWILLLLLLFAFLFEHTSLNGYASVLNCFILNLRFLLAQFLFLGLYFRIRTGKFSNIVDKHIGLGDILFLIVLCAAFSPVNFILFYVLSLLISLFVFGIYRLWNKGSDLTLPLAGTISFCLIGEILAKYLVCYDPFTDPTLLFMKTLRL